jgi:acid phosphatase type 7
MRIRMALGINSIVLTLVLFPVFEAVFAKDYKADFDNYKRPSTLSLQFGPVLQDVHPESIRMVWGSFSGKKCFVEYGSDQKKLDKRVEGQTQTAASPTDHWLNAFYEDSQIHEAKLAGLSPSSTYYYRVITEGEKGEVIQSPEYSFQTAPLPDKPGAFSFVVYGDTREKKRITYHYELVERILKANHNPRFALVTGDNCNDSELFKGWLFEFLIPGKELYARVPPYLAVGNHDVYPIDAAKKSSTVIPGIQRAIFTPPEADVDYYSFRYGNVKAVCIDTQVALAEEGSKQREWLEKTLPKERGVDWVFVYGHHPPLASRKRTEKQDAVSASLRPLYVKHGVDIVFSGHNHHYERLEENNISYIIAGGGGAQLYEAESLIPESKVFKRVHHYCLVEIDGKKLLLTSYDTDGTAFDTLTLEKK